MNPVETSWLINRDIMGIIQLLATKWIGIIISKFPGKAWLPLVKNYNHQC